MNNIMFYHVHRKGVADQIWQVGNNIIISESFSPAFADFTELEHILMDLVHNKDDIDYVIDGLNDFMLHNELSKLEYEKYTYLLSGFYFLRRERALEEGRNVFAPNSPSRLHSIFLSDESDLPYWQNKVGDGNYEVFGICPEGKLFLSSDQLFPDETFSYARQVEESKNYWQPKLNYNFPKEFVFQGRCRIISKK